MSKKKLKQQRVKLQGHIIEDLRLTVREVANAHALAVEIAATIPQPSETLQRLLSDASHLQAQRAEVERIGAILDPLVYGCL